MTPLVSLQQRMDTFGSLPATASFVFGDGIDWNAPLEKVTLYVELPFWLMMPPGPVHVRWAMVDFTIQVCRPWMEVFGSEVTDSRASVIHQGPLDWTWVPSEEFERILEETGAATMLRQSRTVLRLETRGHPGAFRELGEDEPPRAGAEQAAYWATICEAHIPVINELIQRYRLASYDYFAYEVSPWDVPVWQLKHRDDGFRAVLLAYKEWDQKPTIEGSPGGREEGPPARPFEFATAADLDANPTGIATPGEFDLLDARSLMERGDYTGAVRRTVTAIEAVLEWALRKELRARHGEPEAVERLEKTKNDFPGRARQWLKMTETDIGPDRFDGFEETRELRHAIVHGGRRLTHADRFRALRMVDMGRWLFNAIEQKPDRTELREFRKEGLLRSVGRSSMSPRFRPVLTPEGFKVESIRGRLPPPAGENSGESENGRGD